MTHRNEEPPVWETGGTSKSATTKEADTAQYIAGQRRRRAAMYRLPPFHESCRDPWTCRHYDAPESPERNVEGYYATAQHLLAAGLLPAPNVPAMRILWRQDGEQRRVARLVAERWDVAA